MFNADEARSRRVYVRRITMPNFVPIAWLNHCEVMAILPFFKMAAVHHFEFLNIPNFYCQYGSEGHDASPCQI